MKKVLIRSLAIIATIAFVTIFSFTGCKTTATNETTAAITTAVETTAAVTTAVETTAAETTAPINIALVTSVRGISNPFYQAVLNGAELFAKSRGLSTVTLDCEVSGNASSEKQINDIKAQISSTGGQMVLALWPNVPADTIAVAKVCDDAEVYFSNWVAIPPDVNVADYSFFTAHAMWPNLDGSYEVSKRMFEKMEDPDNAKIIVLRGQLGNDVEQGRYDGLLKAMKEYPGAKIVGEEAGEWQRTKGFEITSSLLIKNPDVTAIWSANDDMAMGAIEALRAKELAGKVLVGGFDGNKDFIEAIIAGEAVGTIMVDPKYIGGLGLAIPLAAKEGVFKVDELKNRTWAVNYIAVNSENAQEILDTYINGAPEYDWQALFDEWISKMK